MKMHENFPAWYRKVTLTQTEEVLTKRWEALESYIKKINKTQIRDLTILFLLPDKVDSSITDAFRAPFIEKDVTVVAGEDILELRILAGIALRIIAEGNGKNANFAALCLVSTSFANRLENCLDVEHIVAAKHLLRIRGQELREASGKALADGIAKSLPSLDSIETAASSNPPSTFWPQLKAYLSATQTQISALTKQLSLVTNLAVLREEDTNLLWWLQTNVSRDLGLQFSEIEMKLAVLLLPKELSDLTLCSPGHPAIAALLEKALRQQAEFQIKAKISIADAVNALQLEWRQKWFTDKNLDDLLLICPITHAIKKSLEVDKPSEWIPAYQKASALKAKNGILTLEMAVQMYFEREISKLWEKDST